MESREPLKDFTVGSLPTLFYIPNFISESEESQLLHQVIIFSISVIQNMYSPPFFHDFSSCAFFLFFFWWVLVNLTLVFHVASRFTMPQSPSGKLWKTGDYRTGVSRILSLFVSLSFQHSPLISISYWWVFSVWGYCCCTFVTGGVVHEKGLLPQECK